jgi:hypothetical protein
VALASTAAPPATGEALDPPLDPLRYTGAFLGVQAGGGGAFIDGESGVSASAAMRGSLVLHTFAFDATWRGGFFDDGDLHLATAGARIHPGFPLLLFGDGPLWMGLASIWVRLGLGLAIAESEPHFGWEWGVGLDLPIDDPDDGGGVWAGGDYSRTCAVGDGPFEELTLQTVQLTAAYRWNGL